MESDRNTEQILGTLSSDTLVKLTTQGKYFHITCIDTNVQARVSTDTAAWTAGIHWSQATPIKDLKLLMKEYKSNTQEHRSKKRKQEILSVEGVLNPIKARISTFARSIEVGLYSYFQNHTRVNEVKDIYRTTNDIHRMENSTSPSSPSTSSPSTSSTSSTSSSSQSNVPPSPRVVETPPRVEILPFGDSSRVILPGDWTSMYRAIIPGPISKSTQTANGMWLVVSYSTLHYQNPIDVNNTRSRLDTDEDDNADVDVPIVKQWLRVHKFAAVSDITTPTTATTTIDKQSFVDVPLSSSSSVTALTVTEVSHVFHDDGDYDETNDDEEARIVDGNLSIQSIRVIYAIKNDVRVFRSIQVDMIDWQEKIQKDTKAYTNEVYLVWRHGPSGPLKYDAKRVVTTTSTTATTTTTTPTTPSTTTSAKDDDVDVDTDSNDDGKHADANDHANDNTGNREQSSSSSPKLGSTSFISNMPPQSQSHDDIHHQWLLPTSRTLLLHTYRSSNNVIAVQTAPISDGIFNELDSTVSEEQGMYRPWKRNRNSYTMAKPYPMADAYTSRHQHPCIATLSSIRTKEKKDAKDTRDIKDKKQVNYEYERTLSTRHLVPHSRRINVSATRSNHLVVISQVPYLITIDSSMRLQPIELTNLVPHSYFTIIDLSDDGSILIIVDSNDDVLVLQRRHDDEGHANAKETKAIDKKTKDIDVDIRSHESSTKSNNGTNTNGVSKKDSIRDKGVIHDKDNDVEAKSNKGSIDIDNDRILDDVVGDSKDVNDIKSNIKSNDNTRSNSKKNKNSKEQRMENSENNNDSDTKGQYSSKKRRAQWKVVMEMTMPFPFDSHEILDVLITTVDMSTRQHVPYIEDVDNYKNNNNNKRHTTFLTVLFTQGLIASFDLRLSGTQSYSSDYQQTPADSAASSALSSTASLFFLSSSSSLSSLADLDATLEHILLQVNAVIEYTNIGWLFITTTTTFFVLLIFAYVFSTPLLRFLMQRMPIVQVELFHETAVGAAENASQDVRRGTYSPLGPNPVNNPNVTTQFNPFNFNNTDGDFFNTNNENVSANNVNIPPSNSNNNSSTSQSLHPTSTSSNESSIYNTSTT